MDRRSFIQYSAVLGVALLLPKVATVNIGSVESTNPDEEYEKEIDAILNSYSGTGCYSRLNKHKSGKETVHHFSLSSAFGIQISASQYRNYFGLPVKYSIPQWALDQHPVHFAKLVRLAIERKTRLPWLREYDPIESVSMSRMNSNNQVEQLPIHIK